METPSTSCCRNDTETALAHVADARTLLAVFVALMVLTVITVAVSYFNLGAFNLVVALGVATIKAALVALWFMHLRYDSGLNAFVFLVGVVFLGLFLIIAMLDSIEYNPNVQTWEQRR